MRTALLILAAASGLVAALPRTAAANGAEVFLDAARVCGALADRDLATSAWAPHTEIIEDHSHTAWRCLAEPIIVRGARGSSRFFTTLTFLAESRVKRRVELVKLVLNVHDEAVRTIGRERLAEHSALLFERLGLAAPAERGEAIRSARARDFREAYGTVKLEVWSRPIERLRVTIKAAS